MQRFFEIEENRRLVYEDFIELWRRIEYRLAVTYLRWRYPEAILNTALRLATTPTEEV